MVIVQEMLVFLFFSWGVLCFISLSCRKETKPIISCFLKIAIFHPWVALLFIVLPIFCYLVIVSMNIPWDKSSQVAIPAFQKQINSNSVCFLFLKNFSNVFRSLSSLIKDLNCKISEPNKYCCGTFHSRSFVVQATSARVPVMMVPTRPEQCENSIASLADGGRG